MTDERLSRAPIAMQKKYAAADKVGEWDYWNLHPGFLTPTSLKIDCDRFEVFILG